MKRYLSCELDFETFKVECYGANMNAWAEESPETYPAVIVYRETEIPDEAFQMVLNGYLEQLPEK